VPFKSIPLWRLQKYKNYFPRNYFRENKKCIFAAEKKQSFMNAITISPNNQAQMRLLVALAKEMKMEYHTVEQQRRAGLDEAIEDIEAGRVYKAESVDDMVNQIME
jgi:predicted transcriptional regulator